MIERFALANDWNSGQRFARGDYVLRRLEELGLIDRGGWVTDAGRKAGLSWS